MAFDFSLPRTLGATAGCIIAFVFSFHDAILEIPTLNHEKMSRSAEIMFERIIFVDPSSIFL